MSIHRLVIACALLACLCAGPADAGVNRCIDAQGNVTYTDRPCGNDEKKETVQIDEPPPSATAALTPENRVKRQVREFEDQINARVRDMDARCAAGDKKACKEATCARIRTVGPSSATYRNCATASGYASNDRWAQMSDVSFDGSMTTRVSIVCLQNPEVVKIGGQQIPMYRQLRLAMSNHASADHDRGRWYVNMMAPGDYGSWEEAANGFCAKPARS